MARPTLSSVVQCLRWIDDFPSCNGKPVSIGIAPYRAHDRIDCRRASHRCRSLLAECKNRWGKLRCWYLQHTADTTASHSLCCRGVYPLLCIARQDCQCTVMVCSNPHYRYSSQMSLSSGHMTVGNASMYYSWRMIWNQFNWIKSNISGIETWCYLNGRILNEARTNWLIFQFLFCFSGQSITIHSYEIFSLAE